MVKEDQAMGYVVMDPWAVDQATKAGAFTGAMNAAVTVSRQQTPPLGYDEMERNPWQPETDAAVTVSRQQTPPPEYDEMERNPWQPETLARVTRIALAQLPDFGREVTAAFGKDIPQQLQDIYQEGLAAGANIVATKVVEVAKDQGTELVQQAETAIEDAKKDPVGFGRKALGATTGILSLLWGVTGAVAYDAIETASAAIICNVFRSTLGKGTKEQAEPKYDASLHLEPEFLIKPTQRACAAHPTIWEEMKQAYKGRSDRLSTIREVCKDTPFDPMHMCTYGLSLTDLTITSLAMDGGIGERALELAHKLDAGRVAVRAGVIGAVEHAFQAVSSLFTKVPHPATEHSLSDNISPSTAMGNKPLPKGAEKTS